MMGNFLRHRLIVTAGLWFALGVAGCAHNAATVKQVFSMQDVDCASCGGKAVKKLKTNPNVKEVDFDYVNAELSVTYNSQNTSEEELCELASEAGFPVVPGGGKGRYLPPTHFPDGLDVSWLAKDGQAVTAEDHLVPGKITLIDFYAPWCGPCRKLDQHLAKMLAENEDLALRKINIVDWDSPAAKAYGNEIMSLPHVFVYNPEGERVASISGLELEAIKAAIETARGN